MDRSPRQLSRNLSRSAGRVEAAARNALEVARFGGLETDAEAAPYDVVRTNRVYRLRHYLADRTDGGGPRPPVVLVPPMMLAAEVYDVSPTTSAVRILADHGADPWVVDFGAPEREEGGLERSLTDHVLAVSDAIDAVSQATGSGVHLSGYSQGGMFGYQTAAYRRSEGIRSLVTFGSPVDTSGMIPFGLPEEAVTKGLTVLADTVLARRPLPAWASRTGFRLLDPVKSIRQRVDFVRQLHDRDALLPREQQRRFLMREGWVAWPGPALAELMGQIVAHNRMLSGGFTIEDRLATLADITCPLLCFVGEVDEIAPAAVVRAVQQAAPLADVYEKPLAAGHFGLVVGSLASTETWPTVARWARWQEGIDPRPDDVRRLTQDAEAAPDDRRFGPAEAVGVAANLGIAVARSWTAAASRSRNTLRGLARQAAAQLPRLVRLERVNPTTRISVGLLLDEQAARAPDDVFFLFEGRGHTYGDAKRRIDNIVRGLVSVGVRQGDHVGVLMGTRPSALAVVSALNRLGAVAVMLRLDGALDHEIELGQVRRVIADPEHGDAVAQAAARAGGLPVLVLGGGGEPRELGFGLTDMERIDPDQVTLPAWYRPNPGQGRDLAFILFTGQGARTRANRITNGRWALSAFGTATAAALSPSDTVYCITPIHHPSGLLTSIGGAVAGGARLALTTRFEPVTFWDEVRRYGVTVVSYTWTLVRELLDAPASPRERHHPVRLFVGSGMPAGLWRRTVERFAPAQVLEFYASTEGRAALVNLTGEKVGAQGRPLPGSAEVRIAAYDIDTGRLVEGPDGFAVACPPGEVGMLLARTRRDGLTPATPLRGVFRRDDAWLATGDLFRRDDDGDHWLVGSVTDAIRAASGPVMPVPIEHALGQLDPVEVVVAYGLPSDVGDGHERAVAAVTLRRGVAASAVTAGELDRALAGLEVDQRPDVVRIVDRIPTTTWYRLRKEPLQAEGVPAPSSGRPVWRLDRTTGRYVCA